MRAGRYGSSKVYSSVPPGYLDRQVWDRWDGRLLRLVNQRMESIAVHVQPSRS